MSAPQSSPRQTLSYLRSLFEGRGIRPKNKLGQNFLIDINMLEFIVRTADPKADELILEIGTGTGSLTAMLADRAAAVVTVEVDPGFYQLAQEMVGHRNNVKLLHADALRNKNEMNPHVLAAYVQLRQEPGITSSKLVANLPYSVATPVISNLLILGIPFASMVVAVQLEIAERLTASPGTKDYGALAVLVQSLADVEIVRRLSPALFWPRPKVQSAIVRIVPDDSKRLRVGDVARWRRFLRDLYTHRRKNLRGALVAMPNARLDKSETDQRLKELSLPGTTRAEDLTIEDHLRLCAAFGD